MYCSQCGKKIRKTDTFCSECGSPVKEEVKTEVVANQTNTQNNQNTTNQYGEKQYIKGMNNDTAVCLLSVILMYGVPVIRLILGLLSFIPIVGILASIVNVLLAVAPMAAIALCIYARVHYKDSKFAKILLIVYIVQVVLAIIAVIFLVFACVSIFDSCEGLEAITPLLFR